MVELLDKCLTIWFLTTLWTYVQSHYTEGLDISSGSFQGVLWEPCNDWLSTMNALSFLFLTCVGRLLEYMTLEPRMRVLTESVHSASKDIFYFVIVWLVTTEGSCTPPQPITCKRRPCQLLSLAELHFPIFLPVSACVCTCVLVSACMCLPRLPAPSCLVSYVCVAGFAVSAWLLFGSSEVGYHMVGTSSFTLMRMMLGELDTMTSLTTTHFIGAPTTTPSVAVEL